MTKIPMRKNYEPPKKFYSYVVCPECNGKKFSKEHLNYKLNGISIGLAINEKVKFLITSCIAFIKKANELKLKFISK